MNLWEKYYGMKQILKELNLLNFIILMMILHMILRSITM